MTWQDTVVLWSNSSCISSKGRGFKSRRCQNLFQFKPTKISSRKSEQKKKGTLSLIASVKAVAVQRRRGDEKRKRKKWRHHSKHWSYVVAPSDNICVILTSFVENIDHRGWSKRETSNYGGVQKKERYKLKYLLILVDDLFKKGCGLTIRNETEEKLNNNYEWKYNTNEMTGDAKSLFFLVFVDFGLQYLEWYLLGMYSHPLSPFSVFPFYWTKFVSPLSDQVRIDYATLSFCLLSLSSCSIWVNGTISILVILLHSFIRQHACISCILPLFSLASTCK